MLFNFISYVNNTSKRVKQVSIFTLFYINTGFENNNLFDIDTINLNFH